MNFLHTQISRGHTLRSRTVAVVRTNISPGWESTGTGRQAVFMGRRLVYHHAPHILVPLLYLFEKILI